MKLEYIEAKQNIALAKKRIRYWEFIKEENKKIVDKYEKRIKKIKI